MAWLVVLAHIFNLNLQYFPYFLYLKKTTKISSNSQFSFNGVTFTLSLMFAVVRNSIQSWLIGGTAPFPASLGILKIVNHFNFDQQKFYSRHTKFNDIHLRINLLHTLHVGPTTKFYS